MWIRNDIGRNAQNRRHRESISRQKLPHRSHERCTPPFSIHSLLLHLLKLSLSVVRADGDQIRVPRQTGTCTRCPMEVVLSTSPDEDTPWSCRISLRISYDIHGLPLRNPSFIPFGPVMFDPADVESRLRRAQDAILHFHSLDGDVESFLDPGFVPMGLKELFSRNVVRLDVSGNKLVDVTFIDLPGIISNARKVCPLFG